MPHTFILLKKTKHEHDRWRLLVISLTFLFFCAAFALVLVDNVFGVFDIRKGHPCSINIMSNNIERNSTKNKFKDPKIDTNTCKLVPANENNPCEITCQEIAEKDIISKSNYSCCGNSDMSLILNVVTFQNNTITKGWLSGFRKIINRLVIDSSELSFLGEGSFAGQPFQKLDTLSLLNTKIIYLEKNSFLDAVIKNFEFRFNANQEINFENDALAHLANTLISFQINGGILKPQALRNLTGTTTKFKSLVTLDLRSNIIEYIMNETFIGTCSVMSLFMGYSFIKYIEQNAFSCLKETVQQLAINDNSLMSLPEGIFSDFQVLGLINIANNPWHCDCDFYWFKVFYEMNLNLYFSDGRIPFYCLSDNGFELYNIVDFCPRTSTGSTITTLTSVNPTTSRSSTTAKYSTPTRGSTTTKRYTTSKTPTTIKSSILSSSTSPIYSPTTHVSITTTRSTITTTHDSTTTTSGSTTTTLTSTATTRGSMAPTSGSTATTRGSTATTRGSTATTRGSTTTTRGSTTTIHGSTATTGSQVTTGSPATTDSPATTGSPATIIFTTATTFRSTTGSTTAKTTSYTTDSGSTTVPNSINTDSSTVRKSTTAATNSETTKRPSTITSTHATTITVSPTDYVTFVCENCSEIQPLKKELSRLYSHSIYVRNGSILYDFYQIEGTPFYDIKVKNAIETDLMIWINANNYKDNGCVFNIEVNVTLKTLDYDQTYIICLLKQHEITVSPFDCTSLTVPRSWKNSTWIFNKNKVAFITLLAFILLLAIFITAIIVYFLIRKYPKLVKASKVNVNISNYHPQINPPSLYSTSDGYLIPRTYERIRSPRHHRCSLSTISERDVDGHFNMVYNESQIAERELYEPPPLPPNHPSTWQRIECYDKICSPFGNRVSRITNLRIENNYIQSLKPRRTRSRSVPGNETYLDCVQDVSRNRHQAHRENR